MSSFWPTTPQRRWWHYAASTPFLAVMLWFPFVRGTRVPILGWLDLAVHEFGHVATVWMPRVLNLAMGSGTQVMLPLLLAAAFWSKSSDPLGAGVMTVWAGTSAQDASVYIGDAVAQQLPLIGGVHDWGTLLGPEHLDALHAAPGLARLTWVVGLLLALAGCAMVGWHGWALWCTRDLPDGPSAGPPTTWSLDARGR